MSKPSSGLVIGFMLALVLILSRSAFAAKPEDNQDSQHPPATGVECGIYGVYAALHQLGIDVDFRKLQSTKYVDTRQGSSAEGLKAAAEDCGAFALAAENLNLRALESCNSPVLLHFSSEGLYKKYTHWALFLGKSGDHFRIMDASHEPPLELTGAEVLARWDGVGVIVTGAPQSAAKVVLAARAGLWEFLLTCFLAGCITYVIAAIGRQASAYGSAKDWSATRQIAMLILVGIVLASIHHFTTVNGLFRNTAVANAVACANSDDYLPKLNYEQLQIAMNAGAAVIDARLPADFAAGHIDGAINVPVWHARMERQYDLRDLSKETPIVVYCQSELCDFDEIVAAKLLADGFSDVKIFPVGWTGIRDSQVSDVN